MPRASPNVPKERSSASGSRHLSANHLKLLHTQDLMNVIRATAREMAYEKDRTKLAKVVCEKLNIEHPVLKAIVLAILKGSEDGRFYEVKNNPKVRDMKLSWIGPDWQNVAKAAHNLTTPNLYSERCRLHKTRDCPGQVPLLILRVELPEEVEWYQEKKAEEIRMVAHHISLTIECGQVRLDEPPDREFSLDILLRG